MTKDEEMEQLRQEHTALRDHVARLSERIGVLEAQLAKASYNSHLPPPRIAFIGSPIVCARKVASSLGGSPVMQEPP
jgi:hypothetical protein